MTVHGPVLPPALKQRRQLLAACSPDSHPNLILNHFHQLLDQPDVHAALELVKIQQRWLKELCGASHWLNGKPPHLPLCRLDPHSEWATKVWSLFKYEAIVIAAPGGLFYHQGGDEEEHRWTDGNLTDRSSARLVLYLAMIEALRLARAKGLQQAKDPNWPGAICAYDPHFTEQDAAIYNEFHLNVMGSFDSHMRFKAQPATPDKIFNPNKATLVLAAKAPIVYCLQHALFKSNRHHAVLGFNRHLFEREGKGSYHPLDSLSKSYFEEVQKKQRSLYYLHEVVPQACLETPCSNRLWEGPHIPADKVVLFRRETFYNELGVVSTELLKKLNVLFPHTQAPTDPFEVVDISAEHFQYAWDGKGNPSAAYFKYYRW